MGVKLKLEHVKAYLKMIKEENLHLMCKEQKKLASLIEKILDEEDLYIDEKKAKKYLSYQKYFPFDLFEWESFLLVLMLCLYSKDTNLPRFSTLFCMVGRGAGKNALISYLAFCLMTEANGIPNYNIDIIANTELQAQTSFNDLYNVLTTPKFIDKFKKNFKWNREVITNKKTNSQLRYKTSNAKSADGLRPGAIIFDEVHQYQNWDNINVHKTGLGKVEDGREFYITTNGEIRDSVLDELLNKSEDILDGKIKDFGFLPFICRLDDKEEVHDKDCWFKANPSLYKRISLLKQMEKEYTDYKLNPVIHKSFIDKRMNLPQMYGSTAVTSWDNILATNQTIPFKDLEGLNCTVGIDYASVSDMIGAAICIRANCKYYIISHAWMCTNSKELPQIKAPLKEWEEQGLLTFVDDVEVSPQIVCDWIENQLEKYSFEHLGLDNYRLSLMRKALENINIDYYDKEETTLVRPSDIMKIVPYIDSLFNNHKIVVGDNPLMRWSINNTCLLEKQNGNYVYDKIERKTRKNDLFMAMVHAIIASIDRLEDWDEYEIWSPVKAN